MDPFKAWLQPIKTEDVLVPAAAMAGATVVCWPRLRWPALAVAAVAAVSTISAVVPVAAVEAVEVVAAVATHIETPAYPLVRLRVVGSQCSFLPVFLITLHDYAPTHSRGRIV